MMEFWSIFKLIWLIASSNMFLNNCSSGLSVTTLNKASGELRIVGGFPASNNQTKHQVSIRVLPVDSVKFGTGHICGGSLINNNTVLTACHCLIDKENRIISPKSLQIVGGNLNLADRGSNTFVSSVTRIKCHRKYDPNTFANDIALIFLSKTVPKNHSTFAPIPIIENCVQDNTRCQVSGWGSITYARREPSEILLTANISIINKKVCNGRTSYNGQLKSGTICAGSMAGGVDACQGDSGGGLVCDGKLTGIVSNGYLCATPLFPGIYTDLRYYESWIAANGGQELVNSTISYILILSFVYLVRALS